MKRQDISKLKKNYALNFKLGLILALAFVVMAFNYTSKDNRLETIIEEPVFVVKDIEMIRTPYKKKLPPPALSLTDKTELVEEVTIPDETEIEPETIPLEIEDDLPFDFGEENGIVVEDEIEPEVDEEPLDILIEEPVRDFAEYMPSFGNCDVTLSKEEYKQCSDAAMLQYFAKQIQYPATARENGIQGRVILKFIIDENGKITNPRVLKGVAGGCSQEALRVLNSMPKWKPGRHGGRNVKVNFTLPVSFRLQ